MSKMCIGGLDAIDFFESLPCPAEMQETRECALNRIKYEVAKGIGKSLKIIPPPKKGYKEYRKCGKCGSGCDEAWWEYCPNCGTHILRNDHTKSKVEEYEGMHQVTMEEWLKGGSNEQ